MERRDENSTLFIRAIGNIVLNEFGETDYQIDLFKEIRGGGMTENPAYSIR